MLLVFLSLLVLLLLVSGVLVVRMLLMLFVPSSCTETLAVLVLLVLLLCRVLLEPECPVLDGLLLLIYISSELAEGVSLDRKSTRLNSSHLA